VLAVLAAVKRLANVDEDRVFACGLGDGASGCYHLASAHCTPFAGFLAVGGHPAVPSWSGVEVRARSLVNKPIFALPGEAETAVPWESVWPILDAVAAGGGFVLSRGIDTPISAEKVLERHADSVGEWLKETRRTASPPRITWEGSADAPARVHWIRVLEAGGIPIERRPDRDPDFRLPWREIGASFDPAPAGDGAVVREIAFKSPAEAAGLRAGDRVTEFAGAPVRDSADLRALLSRGVPGAAFAVKAVRGAAPVALSGTYGAESAKGALPRTRAWGSVDANCRDNVVQIRSRGVRKLELLLPPGLVDMGKPVSIRVNGATTEPVTIRADARTVLQEALADDDRTLLCLARVVVDVPDAAEAGASAPAPKGKGPPDRGTLVERQVREMLRGASGAEAVRTLREFIAARLAAPGGEPVDLGPAYLALIDDTLAPDLGRSQAEEAREILKADPAVPSAWSVMERVREVLLRLPPFSDAVAQVRRWAEDLRSTLPAGSQGRLAAEVLFGRACVDEGDLRTALEAARAVRLDGRAGPGVAAAAKELEARAGLREIGTEGPAFSLPTADAAKRVVLEELRGRCVLLLFDAGDTDATLLRIVALNVARRIPSYEMAVVAVPVEASPLGENDPAVAWFQAAFGDETKQAGREYGSEGRSSLLLLSPAGRVLLNGGWEIEGSDEKAATDARTELGPPLSSLLPGLETGPWSRFRKVWRYLARDRRPLDQLLADAGNGPRAKMALRLAAAARGEALASPPSLEGFGLHGALAEAWCEAALGAGASDWTAATATLKKPQAPECLPILDAIFDLGLDRALVRECLEPVARKAEDWKAASMALRALAAQDAESDPSALLGRGQDKRWSVRLALAEGLAGYRHEKAVDALIGLLGDQGMRVRAAAAASLESLTGRDYGTNRKRWDEWRRKEGKIPRFVAKGLDPEFARQEKQHSYAETRASYFGLKIPSNRIVFVLDKSESMYYGLFDGAVEEFVKYLTSAGPTTSFAAIEFDALPRAWNPAFMPANAANVEKAAAFLRARTPTGPTNIMDSITMALEMPQVDAVVLLSDGLPNRGSRTKPEEILAGIDALNRHARVAIHTLWVQEGRVWEQAEKEKPHGPLDEAEKKRRREMREQAGEDPLAQLLMAMAEGNDGTFSVAFADGWRPPPGTKFGPGTDK
jgi:hypothetical protein